MSRGSGGATRTCSRTASPPSSCLCEDPAGARGTRRRVLSWAADHNALVVPAHLDGHGAAEVVRDGSGFAIKGWAPFAPHSETPKDAR